MTPPTFVGAGWRVGRSVGAHMACLRAVVLLVVVSSCRLAAAATLSRARTAIVRETLQIANSLQADRDRAALAHDLHEVAAEAMVMESSIPSAPSPSTSARCVRMLLRMVETPHTAAAALDALARLISDAELLELDDFPAEEVMPAMHAIVAAATRCASSPPAPCGWQRKRPRGLLHRKR
jgi:hypothetical protein